MRSQLALVVVAAMAGCKFEHVGLAGQDGSSGDRAGSDSALHDALPLSDARPPDAFAAAINVAASSAGATLISFTSEYCPPNNAPALCQSGYWNRSNINDGAHASGDNQTAYRAAWASYLKQNANPEEFELAFETNRSAMLDQFVIQNWGRGNGASLYYSTHARIYGRVAGTWMMLVDTDLNANETPQTFTLAEPVVVDRVRLSITDGLRNDYWELGEFEAWGWLQ